jgi:cyclase
VTTPDSLPPPETVEVASGVFGYVQPDGSWWINNTGFVIGDGSVCAIDATSTEKRMRAFQQAITAVTSSPVRTLINTHHHGDHTNGNCLVDEAVIVGHVNCRANMADQRIGGLDLVFGHVEWGELRVVPPDLVFEDQLTVYAGNRRLELLYAGGPAHTTGDVAIWLPDEAVLFAGDLVFNGGTPFVLMGSVAGSLDALARLRRLDPTTVVPGHGPVCGPEVFDVVERYLRWVQQVAASARRAGLTPLEAARETDLGEWGDLLDKERIVGNLHRAYQELEGGPLGGPISVATAFAEMIAFNGGRPLQCMA